MTITPKSIELSLTPGEFTLVKQVMEFARDLHVFEPAAAPYVASVNSKIAEIQKRLDHVEAINRGDAKHGDKL